MLLPVLTSPLTNLLEEGWQYFNDLFCTAYCCGCFTRVSLVLSEQDQKSLSHRKVGVGWKVGAGATLWEVRAAHLLTSHWPELSLMTISHCKEAWEM